VNGTARVDEAIACYRKVLELDAKNVAAGRIGKSQFPGGPPGQVPCLPERGVHPDLQGAYRSDAACAAALAGAGQGADTDKLDKQRARLRQHALDWLKADLALRRKQLKSSWPGAADHARAALTHWPHDSDLSGIRDKSALANLPAGERAACEQLWADVATLLKKAEQKRK
jgi:hypothetical protein